MNDRSHETPTCFGVWKGIKKNWGLYLPLAQRTINYSFDGSIGNQSAQILVSPSAITFWALYICSIYKRKYKRRAFYLTSLGSVEFARYTRFLWSVLTVKRFLIGREKDSWQNNEGEQFLLHDPTSRRLLGQRVRDENTWLLSSTLNFHQNTTHCSSWCSVYNIRGSEGSISTKWIDI